MTVVLGYAAIVPVVTANIPRVTEKLTFAEEYNFVPPMGKSSSPESLRPVVVSHSGIWALAVTLHCIARNYWLG